MGLDQYAYSLRKDALSDDVQVDFNEHLSKSDTPQMAEVFDRQELYYWRKHPNLQGWMGELYRSKGGSDLEFNCVPVRLMPADIDALEAAVNGEKLPETQGFFFGHSTDEDKADDLEFIRKAREAFAEGRIVYYTSWW